MGSNTTANYYIDTSVVKSACKDDFEKIDKACKPEEEKSDKKKYPALRKILGEKRVAKLDGMAEKVKKKHGHQSSDNNAWMASHCDGLWVKPDANNAAEEISEFNQMLNEMSDDLGAALSEKIRPIVEEATTDAIMEKMIGTGVEALAKKGLAKFVPVLGWGLTALDAVDAALAVKDIKSIVSVFEEAQNELKSLGDNMQNKTPTDIMADGMGVLSRVNPCTRARRCLLVPYKKTINPRSMKGEGCCPGQTGHHVIPDEAARACDDYSRNGAPTMCVEGTNGGNGTHGKAHDALLERVENFKNGNVFSGPRENTSYEKMRDMGIGGVQETFPESKCDEKCLCAQLDAYYKNKCNNDMPLAAGKRAPKDTTYTPMPGLL